MYLLDGEEHTCDCEQQIALLRHYMAAGIPYKYMRYREADWIGAPEAWAFVQAYLKDWEKYRDFGRGIGLHSKKLGVGKSFLATYLGRELIKRGEIVRFIQFEDVLNIYRLPDDEEREVEGRLKSCTVLILDEVREPKTDPQKDYYAGRFEDLIRHRTNFNKVTIYTTNMEPDALEQLFPRAASLLASNSEPFIVNGKDVRDSDEIWEIDEELLHNGEVRPLQ